MGKRNEIKKVMNINELIESGTNPLTLAGLSLDKLPGNGLDNSSLCKTSDAIPPALTESSLDQLPGNGLDNSDGSSEPFESLLPVSSCAFGVEIDGRNFEVAKKKLKCLLDSATTYSGLPQVKTSGGLFNWFPHNVTGDELNELTAKIQEYILKLNDRDGDIVSQMGELYQTIDVLDKDYIQRMVISLQCAEKASQEAKDAGIDAQKALKETNKAVSDLAATQKSLQTAQSSLRDTNKKLDKNITQLEETIRVLSSFKSNIDKIQHLKDLDKLWSDYQSSKESIDRMNERLSALEQMNQKIDDDTFEKGAETKKKIRQQKTIVSVRPNHIDELNAALSETQCKSNHRMSIGKKLSIAFALSGASLCIALVELVLLLLR